MSLNGLDDAKVKEAYEAAAAEPGGWFLLKYASRDEIELLGRGNGGIVEIRNAIAAFNDVEPLFGFLRYRRRNVIIKYLPEDCSRLVQARATVHFNSICDRFSPYDTTFSIAAAKELKDTKLSAACSLHAASGSTSSSTSSLRRRRLMEIAEEEEEEQRASKRQSIVQEDVPSSGPYHENAPAISTQEPVTLNAELATAPEHSNFAGTSEPPNFIGIPRPPSPADSVDAAPRRLSSQSTRPELYTSYSGYSYGKTKVKLGPRPSLEASKRPRTAAGGFRPISQIPAGFKLFSKGSRKGKSSSENAESAPPSTDSTKQQQIPEITFAGISIPIPEAPPIPEDLNSIRPHTSSGRPTTSSGISVKSMPPMASLKQAMTPEKARLMKAMKLREKKKKMSLMPPAIPVPVIIPPPEEEKTEDAPEREASLEVRAPATTAPEPSEDGDQALNIDDAELQRRLSMSKADSGIVMDVTSPSIITDHGSEMTQTDSHPASPIIASSEPDGSTKASSLSESTDETVQQANHFEKHDEDSVEPIHDQISGQAETEDLPVGDEILHEAPEIENKIEEKATVVEITVPLPTPEELPTTTTEETPVEEAEQEDVREDEAEVARTEPEEERPVSFALPISRFSINMAAPSEDPEASSGHRLSSYQDTQPKQLDAPTEDEEVSEEEEEAVPQAPQQLKIPKSKFSTQDLRAAAASTTPPVPALPQSVVDDDRPISVLKSKFSAPDLRAAAAATAPQVPNVPEIAEIIEPAGIVESAEATAHDDNTLSIQDTRSEADSASLHSRRSRRKGAIIEPIKTDFRDDIRHSHSDANFSDDDELMEELQSATVQEAMPIIVSKSPATPLLSSPSKQSLKDGSTTHVVRTVSNPMRGAILAPSDVTQSSARAVSSGAAFLHKITQQASSQNLVPKTGKIGSSISQRIKALEKLSGSPGGDAPAAPQRSVASSTFFSVRKPSVREPSKSPSVAERANSLSKNSPPNSTNASLESSPEAPKFDPRDRSGSVASRLSMFEPGSATPKGRPESIQVTARIIRDPTQPFPRMPEIRKEITEFTALDLKQSPLVVDHQKAEPAPHPPSMPESVPAIVDAPKETIQERRASKEKRRSQSQDRGDMEGKEPRQRRSSLSIVKDFIKDRRKSLTSQSTDALVASFPMTPKSGGSRPPSTHHNTSFPRRLSISSRRSSFSKDAATNSVASPSVMTETSGSGDEGKSTSGDKKTSRAGRFIRRLSSSLGGSGGRGKTLTPPGISPTVQEEDATEVAATSSSGSRASTAHQPSIVAYMGDVNVQFPDNLLWKRRSLCIDSQGFLILSAIAATAAPKDKQPAGAGVKRYHLSEFRMPYVPEMEIQELPNSVCLDFVDGSGLQIACEDRAGQLSVLHTLEDAHQGTYQLRPVIDLRARSLHDTRLRPGAHAPLTDTSPLSHLQRHYNVFTTDRLVICPSKEPT